MISTKKTMIIPAKVVKSERSPFDNSDQLNARNRKFIPGNNLSKTFAKHCDVVIPACPADFGTNSAV